MEIVQDQMLRRAVAEQNAGNLREAKQLYLKVLAANTNHIEAKIRLHALLHISEKGKEQRDPPKETLDKLLALYRTSSFDGAEQLARSLSKKFPNHPIAWKVLGALMLQSKRELEAVEASQKAVALSPEDFEALNNLGVAQAAMGNFEEAERSYEAAIAMQLSFPEAHNNLGISLKALNRLYEAETAFKRAIALKPSFAEAHNNLGNTLLALGDLEAGRACLQQALQLKPDFAEAHRYLSSISHFDKKEGHYSEMKALYEMPKTTPQQRCHLSFGLAKANEDLGFFERAFHYYSEGNALRKKSLDYSISQDAKLFSNLKLAHVNVATSALPPSYESSSIIPVFIVGLPRSGTTLVEQIVSSHSKVTGAGELPYLAELGESLATGLIPINAGLITRFRLQYLDKLQKIAKEQVIVVDKAPQNFLYLSLIKNAFPEAKVIHVKRDPAAVCWANFKHYFPSERLGYCYALDDMVQYHTLYENLMAYWKEAFPGFIFELDYELLTVDPERETKSIINYLDLAWEEACLRPEDNERAVTTASNMQVREKIYRDSSLKWRSFSPYIGTAFAPL